jgi:hypothetical protein
MLSLPGPLLDQCNVFAETPNADSVIEQFVELREGSALCLQRISESTLKGHATHFHGQEHHRQERKSACDSEK